MTSFNCIDQLHRLHATFNFISFLPDLGIFSGCKKYAEKLLQTLIVKVKQTISALQILHDKKLNDTSSFTLVKQLLY